MTDQTPEAWAAETVRATQHFNELLDLSELPEAGGLSLDGLSLEVSPTVQPSSTPTVNPLNVSDDEAAQIHLGYGLTTEYFGAVASGYERAVEVGHANGIIAPKKRWPWQH